MKNYATYFTAAFAALFMTAAAVAAEPGAAPKPVKVFVLAGQSNMEGKAKVQLLEYQAAQPATRGLFEHLRKDGKWAERDDVWIKFLDRKGKLTVGYGSPGCIGPELEFGNAVGDRYGGPILLIKTAWGGKSLYRDFRPPGAAAPAPDVLEKMLTNQKAKNPAATIDGVRSAFGASYRAMLVEVNLTLSDLKTLFPQYQGQGYELAGFVWFQGWNDMIDDVSTAEYATNLAQFIRDVRKDLKSPGLPFVIGQMGVGGVEGAEAKVRRFKDAQAQAAALPEFRGNVALVKTDAFWDADADAIFKKGWRQNLAEWNTLGSDFPYHYLGSVKTMCRIGKSFGEAMIALRGESK